MAFARVTHKGEPRAKCYVVWIGLDGQRHEQPVGCSCSAHKRPCAAAQEAADRQTKDLKQKRKEASAEKVMPTKFESVVQQWLDSKTMMSAAGWARYRTHARHWTRFFVGQRGLLHFSGLTSDLVNYYTVARFAELRESGQPGGRPEKTVRDELTALRQCVYWALDHEPPLIGKDIMRKVVRPPVPRKKIPRAFTPAQQAALLSAASGDPRRSLMLHLSLYAGLRREGVAKLRVADVHLEEAAPWLRVEEKTRHTRFGSGEKDERDVPISPQLAESFRRCPAVEGSEHWFGDLTEGAIDREFGELCAFIQRTLGVKGYDGRFHNCRHAFVTDMVDNGVDLQVAAVLAGHSSTRTTEQYRSVRQPLLQAAIAKRAGVGTT